MKRYAESRGGHVFTLHEHARACATRCTDAVRDGRRDKPPREPGLPRKTRPVTARTVSAA